MQMILILVILEAQTDFRSIALLFHQAFILLRTSDRENCATDLVTSSYKLLLPCC